MNINIWMTTFEQRLKAFESLGDFLGEYLEFCSERADCTQQNHHFGELHDGILKTKKRNPWVIQQHIEYSLLSISRMLNSENLREWLGQYNFLSDKTRVHSVGVIMAGNIPAVGFHDFMCVLLSGNRFIGKLSGDDPFLLPQFARILCSFEPKLAQMIEFTDQQHLLAEAIIATGSNNTARYFEYSYGHLPHIFRQNRNGVAVLTGNESQEQLIGLTQDIFLHFGLGCRNISKLYLPSNYDFTDLLLAFNRADYVSRHKPYMNNYNLQRTILTLQEADFYDNGFLIIQKSASIPSPVASIHYEFYDSMPEVIAHLKASEKQIQCIASEADLPLPAIKFGKTQQPKPHDYADGVDTIQFLLNLKRDQV